MSLPFILIPLHEHGVGGYPLNYVPFAVMLVGGLGLRIAALARPLMAWRSY